MAHIVMLIREYYPTFGPTGNCMNNIVQCLKKQHQITVIPCKTDWSMNDYDDFEGIRIERVNNFRSCFYNRYKKHKSVALHKIKRIIWQCLYVSIRIMSMVETTFRLQSIQKTLVRRYVSKLKELQKGNPIDVIITVGQPYESGVAARKFKNKYKKIKIFAYLYDHFTESVTLNRFKILKKIRYKSNLTIERNSLLTSEHTFISPQLKNHYDKYFSAHKEKYSLFEHPLLIEHSIKSIEENIAFNESFINIVYCGMLSSRIRNPEYLLDMLKLIPQSENICFNVFHMGDCDEILNSYKDDLNDGLQNYGQVTLDIAFEAMDKADVLLNMGVTDGNQVSGKIFDYFTFGKPIVHLHFFDEDPNLVYFKDYPLSLCLKIDSNCIKENSTKLLEFCKEYVGKTMPFEEVKKIFYYATPEYVVAEFLKRIGMEDRT